MNYTIFITNVSKLKFDELKQELTKVIAETCGPNIEVEFKAYYNPSTVILAAVDLELKNTSEDVINSIFSQ